MYQHLDDDLMFNFDDGFDQYDADYASASPARRRALTPAQRRWNAWIRSLQRENRTRTVRNLSRSAIQEARQAGAAFGNAVRLLPGSNSRNSFDDLFDEFDFMEGDFDAASPNARRQRAIAERRRRLARQRRARRQQARQRLAQSQPPPSQRPTPVVPAEIPPSQRPTVYDPVPPSQRPTLYNPIPIPPEAYPSGRVPFDAYDGYDDYSDQYDDNFDAWDEDIDAGIGQSLRDLWGRFHRRISPTRRLQDAWADHRRSPPTQRSPVWIPPSPRPAPPAPPPPSSSSAPTRPRRDPSIPPTLRSRGNSNRFDALVDSYW